jgi:hypothetical protein
LFDLTNLFGIAIDGYKGHVKMFASDMGKPGQSRGRKADYENLMEYGDER